MIRKQPVSRGGVGLLVAVAWAWPPDEARLRCLFNGQEARHGGTHSAHTPVYAGVYARAVVEVVFANACFMCERRTPRSFQPGAPAQPARLVPAATRLEQIISVR